MIGVMETKPQTQGEELKEFNDLMLEIAKLPAEKRNIVAIYSQGVLAMAKMQQATATGQQ